MIKKNYDTRTKEKMVDEKIFNQSDYLYRYFFHGFVIFVAIFA